LPQSSEESGTFGVNLKDSLASLKVGGGHVALGDRLALAEALIRGLVGIEGTIERSSGKKKVFGGDFSDRTGAISEGRPLKI